MFVIISKSSRGGFWEEIDTAKDDQERDYLMGEYRMAFGPGFTIDAVEKESE